MFGLVNLQSTGALVIQSISHCVCVQYPYDHLIAAAVKSLAVHPGGCTTPSLPHLCHGDELPSPRLPSCTPSRQPSLPSTRSTLPSSPRFSFVVEPEWQRHEPSPPSRRSASARPTRATSAACFRRRAAHLPRRHVPPRRTRLAGNGPRGLGIWWCNDNTVP